MRISLILLLTLGSLTTKAGSLDYLSGCYAHWNSALLSPTGYWLGLNEYQLKDGLFLLQNSRNRFLNHPTILKLDTEQAVYYDLCWNRTFTSPIHALSRFRANEYRDVYDHFIREYIVIGNFMVLKIDGAIKGNNFDTEYILFKRLLPDTTVPDYLRPCYDDQSTGVWPVAPKTTNHHREYQNKKSPLKLRRDLLKIRLFF